MLLLQDSFKKLVLSVSTCAQPLCITIDSHIPTKQNSYLTAMDLIGGTVQKFARSMGLDDFLFKTTGPKMTEHMAILCKKGINEVINFTWGISKCHPDNLIPLIVNIVEGNIGELARDGVIEAIGNKTLQKIDIFMCIAEVINDYPISSDMLDCIGSFSALFDE